MQAAIFAALGVIVLAAAIIAAFLIHSKRKEERRKHAFRTHTVQRETHSEDAAAVTRRRFICSGIVATGALAVGGIKLWSMTVVNSNEYTEEATENQTRTYSIQAPRGRILDRNGDVLVTNRATVALLAASTVSSDAPTLRRLSNILGIPSNTIKGTINNDTSSGLVATHVIAIDVPDATVAYISEHPSLFPGIEIEERAVRSYAGSTLGAHILGYTGTVSEDELEDQTGSISYSSGDIVGKAGIELQYESVLQGVRGEKTVTVDAYGNVISVDETIEPTKGSDIKLTIDKYVQQVAEQALLDAFEDANDRGYTNAAAGGICCMDVKTGEVLAMASYPTYSPEEFIDGISTGLWEAYNDESSNYPLTNRCISGLYPAASTFKSFTGMAGFRYGHADGGRLWNCPGKWTGLGEAWPKWCWKLTGHGNLDFHNAILQSCDCVFYEIGKAFYNSDEPENLQKYIRTFGFGTATGVDLPYEYSGRVPDQAWKAEYNEDYPEYQEWLPGDTCNIIIGQGDLLVTPLQLCAAYCSIANESYVPKPYLLHSVLDDNGKAILTTEPEVLIEPDITLSHLHVLKPALRAVVTSGSVQKVYASMEVAVAGKTGTAEVVGKDNYALFVGFAPYEDPKYCCACIIEQGGAGDSTASPAVRQVLSAALGIKVEHVKKYEKVEE